MPYSEYTPTRPKTMSFNPRPHYDNCVNLYNHLVALRAGPSLICNQSPLWLGIGGQGIVQLGTAVSLGATSAYADIVALGAAPRYNPAYLTLLQLGPAMIGAELGDLAGEVSNMPDARSSCRALRDYMNSIRDPFNLGIFPPLGPIALARRRPMSAPFRRALVRHAANLVSQKNFQSGLASGTSSYRLTGAYPQAALSQLQLVDIDVIEPVALAAGAGNAYLIYQDVEGVIYLSMTDNLQIPFQPKMFQLSGEGSDGAGFGLAMPATGPALAFDPVANRLIAAYQKDDGSGIIVASIDPNFETPWQLDGTVPTELPILGGLSLAAGNFEGNGIEFLFFAFTSEGAASKFVFTANVAGVGWGDINSVQVQGQALNATSYEGPLASIDPSTNLITIGWTTLEANDTVATATMPPDFEGPFDFTTLNGSSSNLPPCTVSQNGLTTALINNFGTMLYTVAASPGQWQPPVVFAPFADGRNGSPAAAIYWGSVMIVARVDTSGNLQYCMIASS